MSEDNNHVEVDGYTFPKRIGSQEYIEQNVPQMGEEEFVTFLSVLQDRRWTEVELAERVYSIRTPEVTEAE